MQGLTSHRSLREGGCISCDRRVRCRKFPVLETYEILNVKGKNKCTRIPQRTHYTRRNYIICQPIGSKNGTQRRARWVVHAVCSSIKIQAEHSPHEASHNRTLPRSDTALECLYTSINVLIGWPLWRCDPAPLHATILLLLARCYSDITSKQTLRSV